MTLSGDQVPKSADVVIVASQRDCNRDVVSSLGKVVTQVDKALKAEGMSNNRYRSDATHCLSSFFKIEPIVSTQKFQTNFLF